MNLFTDKRFVACENTTPPLRVRFHEFSRQLYQLSAKFVECFFLLLSHIGKKFIQKFLVPAADLDDFQNLMTTFLYNFDKINFHKVPISIVG